MPARIEIGADMLSQLDKELAGLQVLQRMPALKSGLRAAGNIPAKRYRELVPPPGYPGDKPSLKPLRDTIGVLVREYASGRLVGIVGAQYPAGAHAHLLEEGFQHVGGVTVEGRHYLQLAVDATKSEQDKAVWDGVLKAIEEAKKKHG